MASRRLVAPKHPDRGPARLLDSLVTIGRRQFGLPLRRKCDAFRDYLARNARKLHGVPVADVLRRSGCKISYGSARHYMRAAVIKTYRQESIGHRRHRMDWRLPNKALAQVWGRRKENIARLRWMLGVPKAKWDSRQKTTPSELDYLRAVAAERRTAARGR